MSDQIDQDVNMGELSVRFGKHCRDAVRGGEPFEDPGVATGRFFVGSVSSRRDSRWPSVFVPGPVDPPLFSSHRSSCLEGRRGGCDARLASELQNAPLCRFRVRRGEPFEKGGDIGVAAEWALSNKTKNRIAHAYYGNTSAAAAAGQPDYQTQIAALEVKIAKVEAALDPNSDVNARGMYASGCTRDELKSELQRLRKDLHDNKQLLLAQQQQQQQQASASSERTRNRGVDVFFGFVGVLLGFAPSSSSAPLSPSSDSSSATFQGSGRLLPTQPQRSPSPPGHFSTFGQPSCPSSLSGLQGHQNLHPGNCDPGIPRHPARIRLQRKKP